MPGRRAPSCDGPLSLPRGWFFPFSSVAKLRPEKGPVVKKTHAFAFLIVNGTPVIARYLRKVRMPIVRRAGSVPPGPLWRFVATRNFGKGCE
jgi:hypothetical protein